MKKILILITLLWSPMVAMQEEKYKNFYTYVQQQFRNLNERVYKEDFEQNRKTFREAFYTAYYSQVFLDDQDVALGSYKHVLLGKSTACNLYFLYKLDKKITAHVRSMRMETATHIFATLHYILQAFMWRESAPFFGYASPIFVWAIFSKYGRNIDKRDVLTYVQKNLTEEFSRSMYHDI